MIVIIDSLDSIFGTLSKSTGSQLDRSCELSLHKYVAAPFFSSLLIFFLAAVADYDYSSDKSSTVESYQGVQCFVLTYSF